MFVTFCTVGTLRERHRMRLVPRPVLPVRVTASTASITSAHVWPPFLLTTYPLPLPTDTHNTLSLLHTHSITHTFSHSHTHKLPHTHTVARTHTYTHTYTLSHSHTHTHSLSLSVSPVESGAGVAELSLLAVVLMAVTGALMH